MRVVILLAIGLVLGACSPSVTRNPVPLDRLDDASIPNMSNVRYWGDAVPRDVARMTQELVRQRKASGLTGDVTLIALSGGADDGAYSAGLMKAWTELGTRPEFTIVTGISTGALMAPFVFLGSEYDNVLSEIYGGYSPEEIIVTRRWVSILPSASLIDTSPLAGLIEQYANDDLIAAVAREHRRGRRLYVLTTHLDAQRPVIWDLGAIADSGAPNAAQVFRQALLASASIPVGFPAMIFDVEVDGERYDEMHVDGGVMIESTTLAAWQAAAASEFEKQGDETKRVFYVVRNGRVEPTPQQVEYSLLDIAGRAVSTMIYSQGILGLVVQEQSTEARGATYYVTWIGNDFNADYPGAFDQGYMRALSQYGYEKMKSGEAWSAEAPVIKVD